MSKKAIILLSGGLDSATVFAIAKSQGFEVYALSFRYGQRSHIETSCALQIANKLGAKDHKIMTIDLSIFGGSALTDHDILVPKHETIAQISKDIPITYVPARNTVFLSFALAWAEVLGVYDIFIGVNALDYSGYPDCRPEFIAAFEQMANKATAFADDKNKTIKIHTPLINLSKAEIIKTGLDLGLDYSITSSCYDPLPNNKACGKCDSCLLRAKGFQENNLSDPAL